MTRQCPVCNQDIISPSGNPKSFILLIGGIPDEEEMLIGNLFVSRESGGQVLKSEFFREKVDYKRLRITGLWLHPPHTPASMKKEDKRVASDLNERCMKFFMEELLKEADGKQAILLIGSEAVKALAGVSVSDWAGLKITSDYLDAHLIMPMHNPGYVYHNPLGEVR